MIPQWIIKKYKLNELEVRELNILLTMILSLFSSCSLIVLMSIGEQVNSAFAGEGPATYEEMILGLIVIQAVVTFLLIKIVDTSYLVRRVLKRLDDIEE